MMTEILDIKSIAKTLYRCMRNFVTYILGRHYLPCWLWLLIFISIIFWQMFPKRITCVENSVMVQNKGQHNKIGWLFFLMNYECLVTERYFCMRWVTFDIFFLMDLAKVGLALALITNRVWGTKTFIVRNILVCK